MYVMQRNGYSEGGDEMKIKAISLHQPHASAIPYLPEHEDALRLQGITARKGIETRGYATKYRGPILICATKQPIIEGLPNGVAVATATIVGCRLMTIEDEDEAQCQMSEGRYAWLLKDINPIVPFKVTGQQGFFTVDMPDKQGDGDVL